MRKDISEVKGIAKKVFKINWFNGRITSNGNPNSMIIWSGGLIPKPIAKIVPSNDSVLLLDTRYTDKALDFMRQYQHKFLSEEHFVSLRLGTQEDFYQIYDGTYSNKIYA